MSHPTTQQEATIGEYAFQMFEEHNLDGLLMMIQQLLNQAMLVQRQQHLQAKPYERTEERKDYANGFKPRKFNTRMGKVDLSVPQTRSGEFKPGFWERYQRSEKALFTAMSQMYIQGVSTRKVTKVLEDLCGLEVSSSQVSIINSKLDETLKQWRDRELGEMPYILLDATYKDVRVDGRVRSCALLTAYGIDKTGKRRCIGVDVSLSEAEVYWRSFLMSLVKRGLCGVVQITSDSHAGLKAAIKTVFNGTEWQRCQFHIQGNAADHVPKKAMKEDVADEIRSIFTANDKDSANLLLQRMVTKYEEPHPKLALWLEENIPESLSVFNQPRSTWKKLRTSNMVERQNREFVRRMRVVSIFPNEESLLRLASAMALEQDELWMTSDKAYVKMT